MSYPQKANKFAVDMIFGGVGSLQVAEQWQESQTMTF